MIYKVGESLEEIDPVDITSDNLIVGLVTRDEMKELGALLGFDQDTIDASQRVTTRFRTGADVRETYTFAELRLIDPSGNDDYTSLFIKKNLLLVVDILDLDKSTEQIFHDSVKRCLSGNKSLEKMVCSFVEGLVQNGNKRTENLLNELSRLEDSIAEGTAEKDINEKLLYIKKRIRRYDGFYAQMQDVLETLENNSNDILDESNLVYIGNMISRVNRSRDGINSLNSFADHLQDSYSSLLDQRLNNTMKGITVLTTIFFPLTILVGWYGMNFAYMPELRWKYGYLCFIVLSTIVITILLIIGKKKKWF